MSNELPGDVDAAGLGTALDVQTLGLHLAAC